jgi:acetyl esterase/lipase
VNPSKGLPVVFLLIVITSQLQAQNDSLFLWKNDVPGESKPKSPPLLATIDDGSIRVVEITNPFVAVFLPKASNKNGKSIIVCPGGGYVRLAAHKEGYTIANWLTELGYTVFVLQYRVPNKRDGTLHDLQRALRVVRANAKTYGLDAAKVGAMGFSAGAHVVARAALSETIPPYPTQDDADHESARPNCMILIYPAYLDGGSNRSLSPDLKATAGIVDTFIFQTMDDTYVHSSFALATALQDSKANVELHILPKGGHGYGMSPGNDAAETWPKLLQHWLKEHL